MGNTNKPSETEMKEFIHRQNVKKNITDFVSWNVSKKKNSMQPKSVLELKTDKLKSSTAFSW